MNKNTRFRVVFKESTQNRMISLLILLLLFGFLLFKYNFKFYTNDDCLLESLLSGAYSGTPEAHDVYHMYPLAWVITCFYRVIPIAPWYGIFLCFAQFGSLYLCMVRCAECFSHVIKKVLFCIIFAVFYVGIMMSEMVLLQYTVTSAMMGAAAIFLLVTDERKETELKFFFFHRLPILLLYCGAFSLRRQIGILFFPFFLGACLYKWLIDEAPKSKIKLLFGFCFVLMMVGVTAVYHRGFLFYATVGIAVIVCLWTILVSAKGRKQQLLHYLALVGSLLGMMGAIWAIDTIAYSSSEWKEFRAFNEVRTSIYDFGDIPFYQDNEQMYRDAGLTEGDQILLKKYNIALSDRINTDSLERINNFQKGLYGADYSSRNVKIMIEYAIRRVIENIDMPYGGILLALYFISCFLFIIMKRYSGLIELVYMIALRVACWCYLFVQNRFPDRVTHGLYLVEILLLLGICIRQFQTIETKKMPVGGVLTSIWMMVSVFCFCESIEGYELGNEYRNKMYNNWKMVKSYCEVNPDKFYLLDTLSFANYTQPVFHYNNQVQNYALAGGWGVNTPAFYRKLNYYQVGPTAVKALISGKTLYFIQEKDKDIDWLEFCLMDEMNEITLTPVDELVSSFGQFDIYQVKCVQD